VRIVAAYRSLYADVRENGKRKGRRRPSSCNDTLTDDLLSNSESSLKLPLSCTTFSAIVLLRTSTPRQSLHQRFSAASTVRSSTQPDPPWSVGQKPSSTDVLSQFDRGLTRLLHSELHWLDVPQRIQFKLGVTVHRCLRAMLLSTSSTAASPEPMRPVASGSAQQVAVNSSYHDIVAPTSALWRLLLQARLLELAARLSA